MQRTTISSYPHLMEIKTINGIVYKATKIHRPNPKITVMPLQDVQMHQKHESVAAMMEKDKPRRKLILLKNKLKESLKDTVLCSDFNTADSIFEEPDSPARPIPLALQSPAQMPSAKEAVHPFGKVKKILKEIFKPKGNSTSPPSPHGAARGGDASLPLRSTPALKSGFACVHGACVQCSVPAPVTPPNRAPPPVPVRESCLSFARAELNTDPYKPTYQPPSESMSSGFTSTTASSHGSSNPTSSSPTDLDVFKDFDGTYIEPTPPQIAPLQPLSSFVSKLQESLFPDTESSLTHLDQVEGDTTLTVPDTGPKDPAHPTLSASDEENWPLSKSEDYPTPAVEQKSEDTQREWSFKENMPDEAVEFLARRGSVARRRRMATT